MPSFVSSSTFSPSKTALCFLANNASPRQRRSTKTLVVLVTQILSGLELKKMSSLAENIWDVEARLEKEYCKYLHSSVVR